MHPQLVCPKFGLSVCLFKLFKPTTASRLKVVVKVVVALSRALPVIPSFYVASGSRPVVMSSILSLAGSAPPSSRSITRRRMVGGRRTVGLVRAGVAQFVTLFRYVAAVASQALPALPGASPAREGHHADLEPPWADLGRPSRSVPAARA